jgi:CheY-like chemotaxis protein
MQKIQNILLVEDSPDDVLFMQRALTKTGFNIEHLKVVSDGGEAIKYLQGLAPYSDRKAFPFPNVIFTDLKMPQVNGFDLLHWLKMNPVYQVIPTVVMSSSDDQFDVKRAFFEGANCYFKKPPILDELTSLILLIFQFWSNNELPKV